MLGAPGELLEELTRAHELRWTHADELLALVVEKLDELLIATVKLWSKPTGGRTPRPYRYPRPALRRQSRKGSTPEQIRRFFRGR